METPESKGQTGSQPSLWNVYLELCKNGHAKEAAKIWVVLERQDARNHQLEEIAKSRHQWQRRFSFKRLEAIHDMKGPEIFEEARLGLRTPEDGAQLRSLMSEPAVNYHGYICGRIVPRKGGSAARWDGERRAWIVHEGADISVESWFQPYDPQRGEKADKITAVEREEVYICRGVERKFVPFQVYVDAYPLRFRNMAERMEAPKGKQSGQLRFEVDAKSVLVTGGKSEQRYAIWLECRQHGTLVQNLGLTIIVHSSPIVAAFPETRKRAITRKKSGRQLSP